MSGSQFVIPPGCAQSTECLNAYGQISYIPSLGGNAFLLAFFAAGFVAQVILGVTYRTWGYMIAMIGGTGLEIVGYTARVLLHNNDFNNNYFIIYLVGLTIGPALFSAAVYLSLSRILLMYGTELGLLRPRVLTVIFICCDLVSLCLQAAGGAIASLANTDSQTDLGVNIMIAGLSTQVASTAAFACLCLHLMWAIRRYPHKVKQETVHFRRQFRVRAFFCAIGVATLTILIRCSFRVAELSQGFHGTLANNQASFMILDGAMMTLCVLGLTVAHPGFTLGDKWEAGAFWKKHRRGNYDLTGAKQSQESSQYFAGTRETDIIDRANA